MNKLIIWIIITTTTTPVISLLSSYNELCLPYIISPNIELKQIPNKGWGFFAINQGIEVDEILLQIPLSECIESSANGTSLNGKTILGSGSSSSNDMISNILDLVEKRAQLLSGDGMEVRLATLVALSKGNRYVDTMFSQTKDFPEPLSDQVLENILIDLMPITAFRAKRYQQLAHAIVSAIIQLDEAIAASNSSGSSISSNTSKDNNRRRTLSDRVWKSFFLVTSRSFMLHGGKYSQHEDKNISTVWMVPCADLFNHAPTPSSFVFVRGSNNNISSPVASARFFTNTTTGHVIITTTKRVEAGNEIFISYGPKTNADLFVQYGFVLKDNVNDVINVDLNLQQFEDDVNYNLKMNILNQLKGLNSNQLVMMMDLQQPLGGNRGIRTLKLGPHGLDSVSLSVARMLVLPSNQFSSYELNNILGRYLPPSSEDVEHEAGLFVLHCIRNELFKYYTLMETNEFAKTILMRAPERVRMLIDSNVKLLAMAYKRMVKN
jgi:hypothetical protein